MKKNYPIILCSLILLAVACLTGCDYEDTSADSREAEATEALRSEAQKQCGLPNIKNFNLKKLAKFIQEECDRTDLVCYAYRQNFQGDLIFFGKCIGYGLPFSVQYTNPEVPTARYVWPLARKEGNLKHRQIWVGKLPQPDPSGLFIPDGLAATWLMRINPADNLPYPIYGEPELVVSPFPLPEAVVPPALAGQHQ